MEKIMLVDYIEPHKLPHIIVWLDWCFYAYKTSFFVSQGVIVGHYFHSMNFYSWGTLLLAVSIGIAVWVVACFLRNGYGVG